MSQSNKRYIPKARRGEGEIIVQEVADEVVIYDVKTQNCYCLNPSMAHVWRQCDGETTVQEMLHSLKIEHDLCSVDAALVVESSLQQLAKQGLLEPEQSNPVPELSPQRRKMLMKLGALISLPVIASIEVKPAIAQASLNPCNNCAGVSCRGQSVPCWIPSRMRCRCATIRRCNRVGGTICP